MAPLLISAGETDKPTAIVILRDGERRTVSVKLDEASGDTAWLSSKTKLGPSVYDALVSGIAKPLEGNLEANGLVKADSGIWEVHDANKKHFAFTTLAAIRGLCDMATCHSARCDTARCMLPDDFVGFLQRFSIFCSIKFSIVGMRVTHDPGRNLPALARAAQIIASADFQGFLQ